jgi:hypothetical protein
VKPDINSVEVHLLVGADSLHLHFVHGPHSQNNPPSRNPPKSNGRILLPFMRGTLSGRFLKKKRKGNLRGKVPSSIELETFLRVSCPKT